MNRGPSLPRLLGSLLGVTLGTVGHWLTCAGRALLQPLTPGATRLPGAA